MSWEVESSNSFFITFFSVATFIYVAFLFHAFFYCFWVLGQTFLAQAGLKLQYVVEDSPE